MIDFCNIDEIWVFGYGSLMWRPGFEYIEKAQAISRQYKRKFCIYSHIYRGSPETPGLVLGLDEGGETVGVAFKITMKNKDEIIAYLREREQVTSVYEEVFAPIEIEGHGVKNALFYVAKHDHKQYIGDLSLAEQAEMIAFAKGDAGSCSDYLFNTCNSLKELNIFDGELAELGDLVKKLQDD